MYTSSHSGTVLRSKSSRRDILRSKGPALFESIRLLSIRKQGIQYLQLLHIKLANTSEINQRASYPTILNELEYLPVGAQNAQHPHSEFIAFFLRGGIPWISPIVYSLLHKRLPKFSVISSYSSV